jgi:hypothetical protein
MRERYLACFAEIKHNQCWFECYRQRSELIDRVFMIIALTLSAGGLASFFEAQGFSWLGCALIVLGQSCSVCGHLLPYAKQTQAVGSLINLLPAFVAKMELEWYQIDSGEFADAEIARMISAQVQEYARMESAVLNGLVLRRWKRIDREATVETEAFFELRLGVLMEDLKLVGQASS